jgi:hypothetical protein
MNAEVRPLGRNQPPDRMHETLYPIDEMEAHPTNEPMPIGVNWYQAFDRPEQGDDGKYRVNEQSLGSVRGGHCFCLEPPGEPDTERNWTFYDQAREGACEGFGHARALTIMEGGLLLDAFWLYDDARRIEGRFPDGEGATNRGTGKALVKWGAHSEKDEDPLQVDEVIEREEWKEGLRGYGIKSYHWARDIEDVVRTLGYDQSVGEIPILNNWGKGGYPHRVFFSLELIERLRSEEGEVSVLVKR